MDMGFKIASWKEEWKETNLNKDQRIFRKKPGRIVRWRSVLAPARRRLDAVPDFAIRDGAATFRQTFETVAAEEPFFTAPQHLVDAAKNLLAIDISDSVSKVVRDNHCSPTTSAEWKAVAPSSSSSF